MPAYDPNPDSEPPGSGPAQHTHNLDATSSTSSSPSLHNGRASPTMVFNPYYTGRPRTTLATGKVSSVDRQEIIKRIKSRDERSRPSSPEIERQAGTQEQAQSGRRGDSRNATARPSDEHAESVLDNEELGLRIERPRSALHKGDFSEKDHSESGFRSLAQQQPADTQSTFSTSPPAPWHPGFPAAAFRQAWSERRSPQTRSAPLIPTPRPVRTRATSYNVSQFVYSPPTSPLVNQSRPDTPPISNAAEPTTNLDKQSRRHTFSPQALLRLTSDFTQPQTTHRNVQTSPYRAHQPRRSLHSLNALPSTPTSPSRFPLSSRRPSVSSEAHSPLQHAPMVGSYEESILRGRMSTTPSRPLDFIAQIGVLGKGDCKPSLKCPPHVAVPFPAVFYSYGASGRPSTISSDQPSPYVGLIDLENSLPNPARSEKRRQRLHDRLQASSSNDEAFFSDEQSQDEGSQGSSTMQRIRKKQKAKRRSASPKTPTGGCYRIPQQGQLQIVIKNPNKTAVKLFLVPYDLSDMAPGQKTFIRQRSYSAGPIIDMPLSSRKNLGTDRPEASLSNSEDPNDRPVLRYLIHIHIACTGRGRFWLYKSIRVVFANRVPDGKEKLRNEIQLPEPRYSTYKPSRDSTVPSQPTSPSHNPNAAQHEVPRSPLLPARKFAASSLPIHEYADRSGSGRAPAFHLPFQVSLLPTLESRPSSRQGSDLMDIESNQSRSEPGDPLSPTSTSERPTSPLSPMRGLGEPFSFERDWSRERSSKSSRGNGESLLSQRLRGLGM